MRNEDEIRKELENIKMSLAGYDDFDEEGLGTYRGWKQALEFVLADDITEEVKTVNLFHIFATTKILSKEELKALEDKYLQFLKEKK